MRVVDWIETSESWRVTSVGSVQSIDKFKDYRICLILLHALIYVSYFISIIMVIKVDKPNFFAYYFINNDPISYMATPITS